MTALMDTGFVLALLDGDDRLNMPCQQALAIEPRPLLPTPVIPELAYMVVRNIGYTSFVAFMRSAVAGNPPLVRAIPADFARAADIMEQYASSRVDFVDCMIAAMAERLNITRVLTVDQRDFRMFRPKHTAAFEILP